jgi:hypothetical protein
MAFNILLNDTQYCVCVMRETRPSGDNIGTIAHNRLHEYA